MTRQHYVDAIARSNPARYPRFARDARRRTARRRAVRAFTARCVALGALVALLAWGTFSARSLPAGLSGSIAATAIFAMWLVVGLCAVPWVIQAWQHMEANR